MIAMKSHGLAMATGPDGWQRHSSRFPRPCGRVVDARPARSGPGTGADGSVRCNGCPPAGMPALHLCQRQCSMLRATSSHGARPRCRRRRRAAWWKSLSRKASVSSRARSLRDSISLARVQHWPKPGRDFAAPADLDAVRIAAEVAYPIYRRNGAAAYHGADQRPGIPRGQGRLPRNQRGPCRQVKGG